MSIKTVAIVATLAFSSVAIAQSTMSIDWEWKRAHQCSPTSPAFAIDGVPTGTSSLEIKMVDQDVPSYNHGGGTFLHSEGTKTNVPEGALKSYAGPCPPNFSNFGHDYVFTVRAIAADGKTELARGSKTKTFSASAVKQ